MNFFSLIISSFYKKHTRHLEIPGNIVSEDFETNKNIQTSFKEQILMALSYFPELKNTRINFKYSKINTTMQCRPSITSIFKSRNKRVYNIIINNNPNFRGVLLKDVPFNAQIGIIGHELCHILDYENRKAFGIIKRGLDYCSHKSKKAFEYIIDSMTIEKGLGWQLYDWATFSISNSTASESYKSFKKSTYMSASKIEELIKNKYLSSQLLPNQQVV